jgi:translation initiation factor 6
MHVLTLDGNPNIGLYAFCTDSFCLVGHDLPEKHCRRIEEALKVPVHQLSIAGTGLLGVFLAGHERMVLVPSIAFEHELKELERLKIPYTVIDSKITALGNNLLVSSKGCLASTDFSADQKKAIRTALDLPLKPGRLADLPNVGSLAVTNEFGCLVHPESKRFELDFVETLLKVRCTQGTVNGGNPYVGSGLIVNSKGFCTGSQSGGIELDTADRSFGFIGD